MELRAALFLGALCPALASLDDRNPKGGGETLVPLVDQIDSTPRHYSLSQSRHCGAAAQRCFNGGTCELDERGRAHCVCPDGWTGEQCQLCRGRVRLSAMSGWLSDGHLNYTMNMRCLWVISVDMLAFNKTYGTSAAPHVHLHVSDEFKTECRWDHVYVYDGSSSFAPLLAALSGDTAAVTLDASDGDVMVYFYSDPAYNMTGFNISYDVTPCANWCGLHGECSASSGSCTCKGPYMGDSCDRRLCEEGNVSCVSGTCDQETGECVCSQLTHGPNCNHSRSDAVFGHVDPGAAQQNRTSHLARASYGAALIDHNQWWIVGGVSFDQSTFDPVVRFDLATLTWHVVDTIVAPNISDVHMNDQSLNDSMLFESSDGAYGSAEQFGTDLLGDPARGRYDHSLVARGNASLYMYGGMTAGGRYVSNDLWRLDLQSLTWHMLRSSDVDSTAPHERLPRFVAGHTAHDIDGDYMITIGGYDPFRGFASLVQVYYYDENKWEILDSAAHRSGSTQSHFSVEGLYGHTSSYDEHNKVIYVFGGWYADPVTYEGKISDGLYAYLLGSNRWVSSFKSAPRSSFLHSMVLLNGVLIVLGGNSHNTSNKFVQTQCYATSTMVYDTVCDEWYELPESAADVLRGNSQARYGHSAVLHENNVYMFGGFNGRMLGDVFQLITPDCSSSSVERRCLSLVPQGSRCIWLPDRDACVRSQPHVQSSGVSRSDAKLESGGAPANDDDKRRPPPQLLGGDEQTGAAQMGDDTAVSKRTVGAPQCSFSRSRSLLSPGSVPTQAICTGAVTCSQCVQNGCVWCASLAMCIQPEMHMCPARLAAVSPSDCAQLPSPRAQTSDDSTPRSSDPSQLSVSDERCAAGVRTCYACADKPQCIWLLTSSAAPGAGLHAGKCVDRRSDHVAKLIEARQRASVPIEIASQVSPSLIGPAGGDRHQLQEIVNGTGEDPQKGRADGAQREEGGERQDEKRHDAVRAAQCPQTCAELGSCGQCIDSGCMWCATSARCIPINAYLAAFPYGQCTEWHSATAHSEKRCRDSQSCDALQTCADCTALGGAQCGWCDDGSGTGVGQCMPGGARRPVGGNRTCAGDRHSWNFFKCPSCQCNGHAKCTDTLLTSSQPPSQSHVLLLQDGLQHVSGGQLKAAADVCDTCGDKTTGDHCDTCDTGYYGNALNGGQCKKCDCLDQVSDTPQCNNKTDELLVDFIFTFHLDVKKESDRHLSRINFISRPSKSNIDVLFSIRCADHNARVNLTIYSAGSASGDGDGSLSLAEQRAAASSSSTGTWRRFLVPVPDPGLGVPPLAGHSCSEIERVFNYEDFDFGTESNTTFFVYVYGFQTPTEIKISFAQSAPIDWWKVIWLFAIILVCVMGTFAIGWRIKARFDQHRQRTQFFAEMAQLASRPFAAIDLDTTKHFVAHYSRPLGGTKLSALSSSCASTAPLLRADTMADASSISDSDIKCDVAGDNNNESDGRIGDLAASDLHCAGSSCNSDNEENGAGSLAHQAATAAALKCRWEEPTPIAVEPTADYKAAIVTVAVRMPTGHSHYAPCGQSALALGSALVRLPNAYGATLRKPIEDAEQDSDATAVRRRKRQQRRRRRTASSGRHPPTAAAPAPATTSAPRPDASGTLNQSGAQNTDDNQAAAAVRRLVHAPVQWANSAVDVCYRVWPLRRPAQQQNSAM